MKIVHVSTVHPVDDVRIFHKMCRTLAAAGNDVALIVQHTCDETIDGVRIRALRTPRSRIGRVLSGAYRALAMARQEAPDVCHFHDPELIPWALLMKLRGYNVVFDMHENFPAAIRTKHWIAAWLRRPLAWIAYQVERLALRRTPLIFAEHSYVDGYPTSAPSTTILNFPDLTGIESAQDEGERPPAIVYVGRVARQRGSLTTLQALAKLEQSGFGVAYHCVGGSSAQHEKELRQFVATHDLAHVTLHGRLPPQDAWRIAADCSIGLAVLHPVPNYLESYPTKMFEYMALGMPVLVSDFPLYRRIIEETNAGLAVDPLDVDAIADAIRWLVEHPEEARVMGENGRAAALTKYNWQTEGEKLIAFYHALAANR